MGHFGGFLGPNSPKNGQILAKLAAEVVLKERNTVLKFLWEIPIFTETARYQSLNLFFSFCPTLGLIYPMKEAKIEKLSEKKIQTSGYPKIAKSWPCLFYLSNEK